MLLCYDLEPDKLHPLNTSLDLVVFNTSSDLSKISKGIIMTKKKMRYDRPKHVKGFCFILDLLQYIMTWHMS